MTSRDRARVERAARKAGWAGDKPDWPQFLLHRITDEISRGITTDQIYVLAARLLGVKIGKERKHGR